MSNDNLKVDMHELYKLVKTIEDLPKSESNQDSQIVIGTINLYPQYVINVDSTNKEKKK